MGLGQRGHDVEEERLAGRAGLLGPVEHGDAADGRRERGDELGRRERTVEPQPQDADPLATLVEVADRLGDGLAAGAHDDDDPLGGRVAVVLDDGVLPTGVPGQPVHRRLDDPRDAHVEGVDRLARLEVDVRVLGRAAHKGPLGAEGPGAVGADQLLRDEVAQDVVREPLDRVELVRRAEAIEEVHEGHSALQRRCLGDDGEVVGLLDRPRRQECEASLPHRHDVGVVAEDRERLGCNGSRRHLEDRRGQLTGDLVHVGDHQEQALRCGERRPQGTALEGAVHRAGRATLALHLDDRGHRPPDVRPAVGGPLVGQLRHRRRRRDRVDGAELVEPERDVGRGLVPVDGDLFHGDLFHGDLFPDGLLLGDHVRGCHVSPSPPRR